MTVISKRERERVRESASTGERRQKERGKKEEERVKNADSKLGPRLGGD